MQSNNEGYENLPIEFTYSKGMVSTPSTFSVRVPVHHYWSEKLKNGKLNKNEASLLWNMVNKLDKVKKRNPSIVSTKNWLGLIGMDEVNEGTRIREVGYCEILSCRIYKGKLTDEM